MKFLKFLGVVAVVIFALLITKIVSSEINYNIQKRVAVSAIGNSDKVELVITDDDWDVKTVEVSNKSDADKLKQLCSAITGYDFFNDSDLSCGYYEGYAVKFINTKDNSEILVCPALDGCGSMQVGEIIFTINHNTTRKEFDKIVKKYGMDFPWV